MAIKPIFASMLQALLASTPFRSACPGKHGCLTREWSELVMAFRNGTTSILLGTFQNPGNHVSNLLSAYRNPTVTISFFDQFSGLQRSTARHASSNVQLWCSGSVAVYESIRFWFDSPLENCVLLSLPFFDWCKKLRMILQIGRENIAVWGCRSEGGSQCNCPHLVENLPFGGKPH